MYYMKIELVQVRKDDSNIIFDAWGNNIENYKYLSSTPQKNIHDAECYLKIAVLFDTNK